VPMQIRRALTGWGRTNPTVAEFLELPNHEVAAAVKEVAREAAPAAPRFAPRLVTHRCA
jgi:hypothetical protein